MSKQNLPVEESSFGPSSQSLTRNGTLLRGAADNLRSRRTRAEVFGLRRKTTQNVYQQVWVDFAFFLTYLRSGSGELLKVWASRSYLRGANRFDRDSERRGFLLSLEAQLPEITTSDIRAYVAALEEQPTKARKRLARSTVSTHLAALSYLFDCAVREGVLVTNPANAKLVIRRKKNPPKVEHVLTLDEVREVLDRYNTVDLIDRRNRMLFMTLAWTGLRRQEVSELFVQDFTETPEGVSVAIRRKGDKEGSILLPKGLENALANYLNDMKTKVVFPSCFRTPDGLVVVKDRPLSPDSITAIVRGMTLTVLGVAYGPHKLRHAFAGAVWEAGGHLDDIQHQLGHDDPRTTLGYLQRKLSRDRSASELIDLGEGSSDPDRITPQEATREKK